VDGWERTRAGFLRLARERLGWGSRENAAATAVGVVVLQFIANGAGGLLVVLYLKLLFPSEAGLDNDTTEALNTAVFGAYILATVLIAVPFNRKVLGPVISWLAEDRDPTPEERLITVSQPWVQTMSAFGLWSGAAIIFGVLNEGAERVAVGIFLAGLTTCALLYLLLERYFRPIFILALQGAPLPTNRIGIRIRLMLSWLLSAGLPLLGIALLPIGLTQAELEGMTTRTSVLAAAAFVLSGFIMRVSVKSVSDPVDKVRAAMSRVEQGDLGVAVDVDDSGDMGRLEAGFNQMVAGLLERQRLHDLFGRQVGAEVAARALQDGVALGGERRELSALFLDLQGFTTFSEQHTPEAVVAVLNQAFGVVVDVVMDHGGWVDKFEGDAALCVFGAPADQPDHAAQALAAALQLRDRLAALEEVPPVGIGVATGSVVAGNIGNEKRYEYTVIGDAVNVAARLTELAKAHPERVLAAESTVAAAGEAAAHWSQADTIQLRGRATTTPVFAPCA
jgi:adenylate cyclase